MQPTIETLMMGSVGLINGSCLLNYSLPGRAYWYSYLLHSCSLMLCRELSDSIYETHEQVNATRANNKIFK